RAASNRRSWNRLRAWTSNSSTLAKSKDESRPRRAAARWSVGGAASTSIRIPAASGAPARASTRSALFFRPCRLTRCRSPISRSWRCLDQSCAGPSRVRRPVTAQHLDRPLDLAEFVGIPADVGVMAARSGSVGLLDRRGRGPAATEPRRMDPDVLEPENAEGRGDPLRLQVELAEVREDPSGLVAAFDAVAFVVPPESASRPVVASAGEAEEAIGHGDASTAGEMAFRVGGGKGYFQPP